MLLLLVLGSELLVFLVLEMGTRGGAGGTPSQEEARISNIWLNPS